MSLPLKQPYQALPIYEKLNSGKDLDIKLSCGSYRYQMKTLQNPKDIRTSSDPDLAIKTNTSILVSLDGKDVELTAADLIKMRENETHQSRH